MTTDCTLQNSCRNVVLSFSFVCTPIENETKNTNKNSSDIQKRYKSRARHKTASNTLMGSKSRASETPRRNRPSAAPKPKHLSLNNCKHLSYDYRIFNFDRDFGCSSLSFFFFRFFFYYFFLFNSRRGPRRRGVRRVAKTGNPLCIVVCL